MPPCASVWCTARSTPFSRLSSVVPSSGQLPFGRLRAAALRALIRRLVDAVLHEQQLDAAVRSCLERLLPARRRAAVLARLLAPALEQPLFALRPPLLEHRPRGLEQLRARRRAPPPSPSRARRLLRLVREHLLEVGAHVVGADEHDGAPRSLRTQASSVSATSRQCRSTMLVDVPLVARLRPAALVVPARHVLGLVGDLDERAAAQPEHLAALAADGRDEQRVRRGRRAARAARGRARRDLHVVGERIPGSDSVLQKLSRPAAKTATPRIPPAGRSRRRTTAGSARCRPSAPRALVAGHRRLPSPRAPVGLREQRVDPRLDVRGGRHLARVEVHDRG